jgi:hypothetical protein
MLNLVDEYMRKAADAEATALKVNDPKVRRHLLELAQLWRERARRTQTRDQQR